MMCCKCGAEPTRPTRRGMCHRCYSTWWSRRHGYGSFESLYVDAEPARQHAAALRAAGMGTRTIAATSGVPRKVVQWLVTGRSERGTGPSRRILARNADQILAIPVPAAGQLPGGTLVPAVGTVRRMQALVAWWGYSRTHLAQHLGMQPGNATRLFTDPAASVTAATARRCTALFNELQLVRGSSRRAENEGRARGWPLPMDWDEDVIDDPSASTTRTEPDRTATDRELTAQRRQQVDALTRAGYSAAEIADRLDITSRTVVRYRARLMEVAS